MSTPTNQTRSTDPHPRSFFAFGLNLMERLAADEPPPLWLGPVPTENLDADTAEYFARHNPLLAAAEAGLRAMIIDDLRALGVSDDRLSDPDDRQVAAFVDRCLTSHKVALDIAEKRAMASPSAHPRVKTNWLLVGSLCSSLTHQMPGASKNAVRNRAAGILNDGIPGYDLRVRGVTRDHVLRNETAFTSALLARGTGMSCRVGKERALELTASYAFAAINQVEQARTIYAEARATKEFAGLHGLELAEAICDRHDIFECFARVERILQRQRAA